MTLKEMVESIVDLCDSYINASNPERETQCLAELESAIRAIIEERDQWQRACETLSDRQSLVKECNALKLENERLKGAK